MTDQIIPNPRSLNKPFSPQPNTAQVIAAEVDSIKQAVNTLHRIALDAVLDAVEAGLLDANTALRQVAEVSR